MGRKGISVNMEKQIKELIAQGRSQRKIARALKVSRKTIRRIQKGVLASPQVSKPMWDSRLNWEDIQQEHYKKHVTVKQLWSEYSPQVTYSRFLREFKKRISKIKES